MKPAVSVLIPVYNCERYLESAIDSVLEQTFRNFEIILVNDGSSDRSGEIAASYSTVRLFNCEHKGIPAARNFALSKAEGELIAFLDSDDMWVPEKLELQMNYLNDHPDCEIIFCNYRNFTDIPKEQLTAAQRILLDKKIDHCLTAACIKKTLFERFGGFDPDCAYAEDTEWTARIIMGGVDVSAHLDDILYMRRVHTDNITMAHNDTGNKAFYSSLADSIRNRLLKGKQET